MSTVAIKPIAICISDIHFNLSTLEIASKALQSAIERANNLNVPLVIAGDLNDTKAIIRAEVANRLITLLRTATTPVYIIVGNHDLINEKGEEHSLNFLRPYAKIVSGMAYCPEIQENVFLVSYQNNPQNLKYLFKLIDKGSIVIMHQGFQGAYMGDYIIDKTSVDPNGFKDYNIISGHYHRHQTVGTVTYIGSPFTTSFGEANDGGKGFLILNSDGSFDRAILALRRHYKIELQLSELKATDFSFFNKNDLVWLKIHGPTSELKKIKKKEIMDYMDFKLDLIPTDSKVISLEEKHNGITEVQLLMILINNLSETEAQKHYLKELFYEVTKC